MRLGSSCGHQPPSTDAKDLSAKTDLNYKKAPVQAPTLLPCWHLRGDHGLVCRPISCFGTATSGHAQAGGSPLADSTRTYDAMALKEPLVGDFPKVSQVRKETSIVLM